MEMILKIAAVLSAIGVIGAAIRKFYLAVKNLIEKINSVSTTLVTLEENSKENYMSLLRLTIMSSEMPIGERIVAGHKYLENNGNGEVKRFLESEFNITSTVDEAEHYKK